MRTIYPGAGSAVEEVIFAPEMKAELRRTGKRAGGTDAGKAIGCPGAQTLVKLLELEILLELDHVSALVSLSVCSRGRGSRVVQVKYVPPTKVTRDVESLLFGRIRLNHSSIGPSPLRVVYFETGSRRGNCIGILLSARSREVRG
ncbi:hypothetical protein TNCV_4794111 [Trichonephila clavipes]|nr:hypothetical protein TNCV_4794111 [Trichonephila clavipes]